MPWSAASHADSINKILSIVTTITTIVSYEGAAEPEENEMICEFILLRIGETTP